VAKPAGPDPMTATFFPVLSVGLRGATNPFSNAISMICFSISSIATAG
jgi:hypothetical protein